MQAIRPESADDCGKMPDSLFQQSGCIAGQPKEVAIKPLWIDSWNTIADTLRWGEGMIAQRPFEVDSEK